MKIIIPKEEKIMDNENKDNKKNPPVIPLDVADTDETREPTGEDLRYNESEDSFELDPETADKEYRHPQPYNTAAPEGEDDNSAYDEENPYTPNEYRDKQNEMQGELNELDRTVTDEELTQLDEVDEQLANTAEDTRDDLDAEGYPRRDERDPLGDKQIQSDDPTETSG
ncbi:hypothetical protein [Parapedobacter sp. 10938]|uniref:hypothetical protein n=1 Tax=Parapedobacter flavus TaxID=3110225 RepID=UPI002DBBBD23|nr:hypothetical protein [Parapedobacter sp. 10938]MEC3881665.1 hypothetical protein [Parapedobacter sp. 10938]